MNPIDFRDLLYEVKEYTSLPPESRARKKAFVALRKSIEARQLIPNSIWTWIRVGTLIVDVLWFAAMAVCAIFQLYVPKWMISTWLTVMILLSILLILTQVGLHQFSNPWVHRALDELGRRMSTLSPAEYDAVEALLWNAPAYIYDHPIVSSAPCGCIRCGQRFTAREMPCEDSPFRTPLCPHCGASAEFLVYSDEEAVVTAETLSLLHNLFNEEN